MIKKLIKLICGILLSSFGITMVIHAQLGVFPITAANIAIANWLGISIGFGGVLVELVILGLALYLGEGLSFTGIVNATIGSLLVDVWNPILPYHPLMVLGILLLPIAWYLSGSIGLGDTNQNLLTNGILKRTNKSMGLVRGIQESLLMIIGLIGGKGCVTPLTIILSLFFGKILEFEYKLLGYRPEEVNHKFIIKGKSRNEVEELAISKESKK